MDDLIHRREALDAVTDELDMIDHVPQWVFDRLEKRLKQLPSAQPEKHTNKRTETHACYSPLSDFEYYQLVLTHRDGHDSNIELPITAKVMSPLMQKLECDDCEALIDDLYRQLKEFWMLKRRNGERGE